MELKVLVTGATAGFGVALCERFVALGHLVVGAARRADRLAELRSRLGERFFGLELDVSKTADVASRLEQVPSDFAAFDVVINNAGVALGLEPAHQAVLDEWMTMIATNVAGLTAVTRAVLPGMVTRRRGHVVNIGSVAGTYPYPGGNVYGASKAFVRHFSLNLRADLHGTGVRVTNLEPGLCGGTEFSEVRFRGDAERAAKRYEGVIALSAQDIADTAAWVVGLPPHVNVNTIELMPVAQSFGPLPIQRSAS